MKKIELSTLSDEVLANKIRQRKTVMAIFIVIILGLLFFFLRDVASGEELDIPVMIIIFTSLGGLLSIYIEYKGVKDELSKRKK